MNPDFAWVFDAAPAVTQWDLAVVAASLLAAWAIMEIAKLLERRS